MNFQIFFRRLAIFLLTFLMLSGAGCTDVLWQNGPTSSSPEISVSNQTLENDRVVIDEIVSPQDGWVVIHRQDNDEVGEVVGFAAIQTGINSNLEIPIDADRITPTLYAMLHEDSGQIGTFEFPEGDIPFQVDGSIPAVMFSVEIPEEENTMTESEENKQTESIKIENFSFTPATLRISKGTRVEWTNEDTVVHTVTSDSGLFDSGDLAQGKSFSFVFNETGTFDYFCRPHPNMRAKIIVEEEKINEEKTPVQQNQTEENQNSEQINESSSQKTPVVSSDSSLQGAKNEVKEDMDKKTQPLSPSHVEIKDSEVNVGDSVNVNPSGVHVDADFDESNIKLHVEDQSLDGSGVRVNELVVAINSWIVIHADNNGAPGDIIGKRWVEKGINAGTKVDIDTAKMTPTLWAMVHSDKGQEKVFEPALDIPLQMDGKLVQVSFRVVGSGTTQATTQTNVDLSSLPIPSVQENKESLPGGNVSIANFQYSPANIRVKKGDPVTWMNNDYAPHTVSLKGIFDSGMLMKGESFSYTFTNIGTFEYTCSLHPQMKGIVIVE